VAVSRVPSQAAAPRSLDEGTSARVRTPPPGSVGNLTVGDTASSRLQRQSARLRQQAVQHADYTVWLVKLVDFPNDQPAQPNEMPEATAIQLGVQDRLQALFDDVARLRPGHPRIALRWVTDMAQLRPADRELVIYFVGTFMTGVIQPQLEFLRLNARTPELRRHYETQYNAALPSAVGGGLPEDGLTFTVQPNDIRLHAGPPWTVSEVYVSVMLARDFPGTSPRSPSLAGWVANMHDRIGCQIANVAFHEGMHNKIDPAHTGNWNMHTSGGGGLAVNTGSNIAATTGNLSQFAAQLFRVAPRQYVHLQDRLSNP